MKIQVTKEDLATTTYPCPLARAFTRALGRPILVSWTYWLNAHGDNRTHELPQEAKDFIKRWENTAKRTFDPESRQFITIHKSKEVPFEFEVELG